MNYKTEQEKQDKEFDKSFNNINKVILTIETLNGFNEQKSCEKDIKSYLLSRDTALLEAFKKDITENIAYQNLRDHQQQLDEDGVFVGVSRQALDSVLSLLKDYKLNK